MDKTRGRRYQCKTGWEYCTGIGLPKTLKGK